MIRNDSGLETREDIIQQLKKAGLKITPQRLAIVEVLIENGSLHPGAGFIYKKAKKIKKTLSLSTTYSILDEFSRLGIIKKLQFDRMENRYETNAEEHINLICEGCGKILDYQVVSRVDWKNAERKTGFSIKDTRLECYGYCRECLKGSPD
ncbi:MAG TPA: Fur family transcriptional regulator [Syntrophorhabdaceae bacterium]|nr:Fur family transcriptional regulator [Syntrophorhabdaceae bacterium]